MITLLVVDNANVIITTLNIDASVTIRKLKHEIVEKVGSELDINAFNLSIAHLKPLSHLHSSLMDYGLHDGDVLLMDTQWSLMKQTFSITIALENSDNQVIEEITIHHIHSNDVISSHVFIQQQLIHKYCNIQEIELFEDIEYDTKENQKKLSKLDATKTFNYYNITSDTLIIAKYPHIKRPLRGLLKQHFISRVDNSEWKETETYIHTMIHQFREHMSRNGAKSKILDFYRIEKNREMNHEMQQCILKTKKNPKSCYLFHGTSFANVHKIIMNGFNRDYNTRSLYGKGTYLADNAYTASRYCVRYTNKCGVYVVLVCSTVIGECIQGNQDMNMQSLTANDGTHYDTIVDDLENPKIYVINRDYHTFAEYIILFRYLSDNSKK